jgi:hypothetical protein
MDPLTPDTMHHWTHERASVDMFQRILQNHPHICSMLTQNDVYDIIRIIIGDGTLFDGDPAGRWYLYEIVSNHTCGIDVDRIDYLNRDSASCGIGRSSVNVSRLASMCAVVDGHFAFNIKEAGNIDNLFNMRYTMHRTVYTHKAVVACTLMIVDIYALLARTPLLDLVQMLLSPAQFERLTDHTLYALEWNIENSIAGLGSGDALNGTPDRMRRAATLMQRIRSRNLYVRLAERALVCEADSETDAAFRVSRREDSISNALQSALGLGAHDDVHEPTLFCSIHTAHHGAGADNPMVSVPFFSDRDPTRIIDVSGANIMFKRSFKIVMVRVYATEAPLCDGTGVEITADRVSELLDESIRVLGESVQA